MIFCHIDLRDPGAGLSNVTYLVSAAVVAEVLIEEASSLLPPRK